MESVKELRRICQEPRRLYDTWHGRKIARRISIYITIIFLRLGLSANFATGLFLLCGICGSLILILGTKSALFISALVFQLWYVLDHVDGEIARYKKQTSLTGIYFDNISHYIVHPLFFFCLGLGSFLRTGGLLNLIAGFVAGLSLVLINIIVDMYEFMLKDKGKAINEGQKQSNGKSNRSILRKLFSLLHQLCTFPVIIDVFIAFALMNLILKKDSIVIFLWFYAFFATFVWIGRLSYFILTRKLDKTT